MRSGILAGGNWIVDYVKTIDTYPEQDALANILDETVSNGGAPYNLLVDLALLGAPFPLSAVGLVGDDDAGRSVVEHCARLGIDTTRLMATPLAPTSYTQVMSVQSTGRRTFFHCRGANALLSPSEFDFSATEAKIFHLGYLLLLDSLDVVTEDGTGASDVLRRASEAGLITSIDVVSEDSERFGQLVIPALKYCDVCFMNEFEAERTTGIPLRGESGVLAENLESAAKTLLHLGVRQVAVIHFAKGALAATVEGVTLFQPSVAVPPSRVVGAVGSGDAFAAGFLLGWHEGQKLEQCLTCAVCAAAACVMDRTTSGGIGTLEKCLALADNQGLR